LRPPPFSGRVVDAVRPPRLRGTQRRLIASCTWCLANRHCENCHRWWCGECYDPRGRSAKLKDLEKISAAGLDYLPSRQEMGFTIGESSKKGGDGIKFDPNKGAVTRECWDCGRVCARCALVQSRTCIRCKGTYCILHNTGCDEKTCDWCAFRGSDGGIPEI